MLIKGARPLSVSRHYIMRGSGTEAADGGCLAAFKSGTISLARLVLTT